MRRVCAGDHSAVMEVDLIFKIAAVGIIISILNQVLVRSGREEQALLTALALSHAGKSLSGSALFARSGCSHTHGAVIGYLAFAGLHALLCTDAESEGGGRGPTEIVGGAGHHLVVESATYGVGALVVLHGALCRDMAGGETQ